jgi:hypothetical protein
MIFIGNAHESRTQANMMNNRGFFMRTPVIKEQSHRRSGRIFLSSGAIFTVKNPCGNSGTPEPGKSPVIPHFPHPRDFRGNNSGKMRNRAGIIQRFPTGTDEVEYSDVTKAESKEGVWFGTRAGTSRRIFQHPPREASRIKRNSTEQ